MSEDTAPEQLQVGFTVLHFGQSISFSGDAAPLIADEGDVLGVFPHHDGTESIVLLSPDQALAVAEAIMNAALRGRKLLEAWEAGNDRP